MPQEKKTLIMKFGGAAVKTPASFSRLAELIIKRKEYYPRIVVVVSAMGGMTDHLISLALDVNPSPPRREYDMLVSVGERISISLLAMALAAKGEKAVSFTGSQSGILTTEEHSEARIVTVRPYRLLPYLDEERVVIVAGFQGVSAAKEITTLGRGGSDTSAVALGVALRAEKVEFYKDVRGIFSENPVSVPAHISHQLSEQITPLWPHLASQHSEVTRRASCQRVDEKCGLNATVFHKMTYEEALKIIMRTGGRVLHPRALLLAQKNNLPLHVRSFRELEGEGTMISIPNPQPVSALYEL